MGRFHTRAGAAFACAALALVLAGCGDDDSKGMGDAPVLNRRGDDTPAEVYNFPDHFGNLATKCVGHGYRAYVTTNKGAPSNIEVVPDPACVTPAPTASPPPTMPSAPARAVPSAAHVPAPAESSPLPAAPDTAPTGLPPGEA